MGFEATLSAILFVLFLIVAFATWLMQLLRWFLTELGSFLEFLRKWRGTL